MRLTAWVRYHGSSSIQASKTLFLFFRDINSDISIVILDFYGSLFGRDVCPLSMQWQPAYSFSAPSGVPTSKSSIQRLPHQTNPVQLVQHATLWYENYWHSHIWALTSTMVAVHGTLLHSSLVPFRLGTIRREVKLNGSPLHLTECAPGRLATHQGQLRRPSYPYTFPSSAFSTCIHVTHAHKSPVSLPAGILPKPRKGKPGNSKSAS